MQPNELTPLERFVEAAIYLAATDPIFQTLVIFLACSVFIASGIVVLVVGEHLARWLLALCKRGAPKRRRQWYG